MFNQNFCWENRWYNRLCSNLKFQDFRTFLERPTSTKVCEVVLEQIIILHHLDAFYIARITEWLKISKGFLCSYGNGRSSPLHRLPQPVSQVILNLFIHPFIYTLKHHSSFKDTFPLVVNPGCLSDKCIEMSIFYSFYSD